MIDPKGLQTITVHLKGFLRTVDLFITNLKGQLRCDDAEGRYHPLQPFGTDEGQGLLAVCISHGQKKPGQAADVVPVVMGKTDHINGLEAPSFFLDGNLCAFSAVDQHTAAIISQHQGGEPPIGKRHHSAASQ